MEGKENIRVEVRDRGARQEEEKAAFVTKIKTEHVNLYYGERQVLKDITFDMGENKVTAFIGPSGCGKSSYLRCLNRMNDFISSARVEGTINIDGENILAPSTDVIGLRRKVGMVFQKPNPFPMSIYDNIAYGPRLNGIKDKDKLDEIVEKSLEGAALWDEVKDKLRQSAHALSGGQQQRLCIARTLAMKPDVVLFDEPCSALDPISTFAIEETIRDIAASGICEIIVTHNMEQATRVSDRTAFFYVGDMIETGTTQQIFSDPHDQRLVDYLTGRFG